MSPDTYTQNKLDVYVSCVTMKLICLLNSWEAAKDTPKIVTQKLSPKP